MTTKKRVHIKTSLYYITSCFIELKTKCILMKIYVKFYTTERHMDSLTNKHKTTNILAIKYKAKCSIIYKNAALTA